MILTVQTDYLDLYLIHWPVRLVDNGSHWLFPTKEDGSRNVDWEWKQAQTWKGMEALLETGKVKAIGVSNFSEIMLKELKKSWKVVPAVNQVSFSTSINGMSRYCSGSLPYLMSGNRAQS